MPHNYSIIVEVNSFSDNYLIFLSLIDIMFSLEFNLKKYINYI